ncbi:MAG: hypothetical protein JOZ69_02775 [Myxococcales bacterium]|nr:hypothetical protein [Myxococcales bacterium]
MTTSGLATGRMDVGAMMLIVAVVVTIVIATAMGRDARPAWVLPLAALSVASVVGERSVAIGPPGPGRAAGRLG